jgi:predicted amidohydrolase YtcJ
VTDAELFVGGRVYTGRRYCDALLAENGEVVVVGSEAEVRRAAPTGASVHSLAGALMLPGLIDAHFHVADVTRSREGLDLSGANSIEELAATVRRWAEDHPRGPVIGRGWDPERFPGHIWPTRRDIDRVVSDRPAVLAHVSGHAAVVNSSALLAAGMEQPTPDPPGGAFGRTSDGALDGRLFDSAIAALEQRLGPAALPEPAALVRTLRSAATLGLTTLGAMSASPEEAVALREIAAAGTLPGRVRVYLRWDRWEEYYLLPEGPSGPPGRFSVVGVKAYTDGAFGTRTAWLSEPYADDPSRSGLAVADDSELRWLLAKTRERGLTPALHAIGDRAVAYCLDRLEEVSSNSGPPARIEHAALTPPALFSALARVRPALVVQPGFVWSDYWLADRLGPERARWAYAFRSLTDRGHLLVGSSDAPYDPVDPWRGIQAAVHRVDPLGRSANPTASEVLTAEEAVRLYTANAGVAWREATLGLLEPGSPADLLVVGSSTLEGAIAAGSAAVRETWVAGARLVGLQPSPGEQIV